MYQNRKYKLLEANISDGELPLLSFPNWLQNTMANVPIVHTNENECELHDLLVPPSFIAKSYKNMVTYGNHLRTATWLDASNMVTYDSSVMGKFEHMLSTTKENPNLSLELVLYIKECKEILELTMG
jgi:hypothetical protein